MKFKVIGNRMFNHVFKIGQIVTLIQIYPDGVYEVSGKYFRSNVKQDIHPMDLKKID